jgi:hypothetical protein
VRLRRKPSSAAPTATRTQSLSRFQRTERFIGAEAHYGTRRLILKRFSSRPPPPFDRARTARGSPLASPFAEPARPDYHGARRIDRERGTRR